MAESKRMETLRERVVQAVEREAFRQGHRGWIAAADTMADAALAALGLDDLEAAVERGASALAVERSYDPNVVSTASAWSAARDRFLRESRAVLEAALTATTTNADEHS